MSAPTPVTPSLNDPDDLSRSFGFGLSDEEFLSRVRRATVADALGRLGPYELLEEIGHGGQGAVYRARQPGTHRDIALKRLAAGSFATSAMRARFDREIEAAGALNHPNVVRVYGVESIDAQAVLVMEWIDGVPIHEWAAAGRSVRQLLEAFVLVCDAVGYAHQRGVLHRDLKPSNILVDERNQPHVLDFGLAKRLPADGAAPGASTLTQGSGFMGTPAYASPEQVAGDWSNVDVRSDVYGLGAILYQMVTGAQPFGEHRSIADLFDAIRGGSPRRPSEHRNSLNREVDAMVLKALARDPGMRYQSVDALTQDVRRFLNNETVLAHSPSAMYQLRKSLVRHRVVFSAAVAVVAALALGLAGVSLALLEARAARQQAEQSEAGAQQVSAFLNQILAGADPTVTRGYDAPVSALLDEAVEMLDAGALTGQAEAETLVRLTIADAYLSLGLYSPAQAQYEMALTLRQRALGEMHLDVAESMLKLAFVLTRQEQFDAAHQNIDEALRIRTALAGPESLLVVQALAARAEIWIRMGRVEAARPILCDLLPRVIRLTGNEDNDDVALIKGRLGFCDGCAGAIPDGIRLLEETLVTERRLFGPEHERLARTLINLGVKHQGERRYELAESLLQEALAIRRRVYGNEHPATAIALFNLGGYYYHRQRWTEAEAAMREALAIQELRLVPGHYETGRSRHYLAHALMRDDRCDEAEPHFRRAIEELRDQPSLGQARRSVSAQMELAECLTRQRRFEEAEMLLLEAVERLRQLGDGSNLVVRTARGLVKLYEAWDRPNDAAVWQQRTDAAAKSNADESQP